MLADRPSVWLWTCGRMSNKGAMTQPLPRFNTENVFIQRQDSFYIDEFIASGTKK